MFGPCKVCLEKDKRVQSLENEISFLRGLVRPTVDNSFVHEASIEANGVLDGADRPIEIQTYAESVEALSEEELRERNAILSGEY